ncbi:putative dehydrogenase [Novosphingobium sp. SG751A]|uniref:Gfo/Idh/MocA family protein n=1 Tax=Novosphingobium sp. SG751A TaxID=2587000 RepID=UPI001555D77A|nr:Gfo/Idh/MocA family oxidoreductase [Novosphingobium sp. SG751A]NOW45862.1 putative dehydrogenase [Novosphingobium sp. SG751A]
MATNDRPRLAMLGGGPGSFIGGIHHLGARIAGIDLVAGVFSSDPEKSARAAQDYGVAPDRCYASAPDMFAAEAAREDGITMVAIATPNHLHLPAALMAIEAGVHIFSDKPATATLAQALTLRDALARGRSAYALSFTYSAYPMVREARARIAEGQIGTVRKVLVNYAQGVMAGPSAGWRTDPGMSGAGGCIADLGTHAFHLAEFATGQRVAEVLADLGSHEGRVLDDDDAVLLRFAGGGRGMIHASQIAFGQRNAISLQVYGDKGALHWEFETADQLRLVRAGEVRLLGPASADLLVRVPGMRGIGEGLIAPFATLYREFAAACGGAVQEALPGIAAGVRSMAFVESAVESSAQGGHWLAMNEP